MLVEGTFCKAVMPDKLISDNVAVVTAVTVGMLLVAIFT